MHHLILLIPVSLWMLDLVLIFLALFCFLKSMDTVLMITTHPRSLLLLGPRGPNGSQFFEGVVPHPSSTGPRYLFFIIVLFYYLFLLFFPHFNFFRVYFSLCSFIHAASAALSFTPIGVIESVYRQRNGTPRQGVGVGEGNGWEWECSKGFRPIYNNNNIDDSMHKTT